MRIILNDPAYCKVYTLLIVPYLKEKMKFAKDERKKLYEDFIHCAPEFASGGKHSAVLDATKAHKELLLMRIADLASGTLHIFLRFAVAHTMDEWTLSGILSRLKADLIFQIKE